MKERIRKLLESEGISAAGFADKIGVQRSSISHILSGRNKPSLDFIQKLLEAYHHINADWLIMGKGEIYGSIANNISETDRTSAEITKSLENKGLFNEVTDVNNEKTQVIIKDKAPEKEQVVKKSIVKIVNFYNDHTFEEYFPA